MLRALFLIALFEATLACAAIGAALPTCPPNWKLEMIAAAPQIRHPSVVCCAPDGRVFVAEDPMDISAPTANLTLGRILCFHPNGKVTVFADKLYAVFGMQYLEGKLYVLNNPRFSVFIDDNGTGKDRVDLIESTNPNPWALDWNDHVPANFKLAMDGFFYVAAGDKGVFGAVGRDGRRVDMHGGGILRLRPDGTELEVFSTGVRNILDVAINDEDDIFTYDNTDEQQWMSRVTHMVDGGFYGYPYDFIPRRPYTLWMMADYGGGAATGTLAYNEDALPPEYHGNLFLADFGKRQLLRLRAARDGATYRVLTRDDFFSEVPNDFRPVGIALSPDGMSIYLCDWNHDDTKEKVDVGRLLKLSYTGKSHAAPKPDWYLPAAMGRPVRASNEQLVEALSHPARDVRLVAQRRIVRDIGSAYKAGVEISKQPPGLRALVTLLLNTNAPPLARCHAIWALDAIDGGRAAPSAIRDAITDAQPSVRQQAIRQLGTRRVEAATGLLVARLKDADAAVRFQAATALGRIGNASAIPALLEVLADEDSFTRYAAFTALNRIGGFKEMGLDPTGTQVRMAHTDFQQRVRAGNAWSAIARGLESSDTRVREGTAYALRETYDVMLAKVVAALAGDRTKTVETRAAALGLLASVHRKTPEWKGEWWAYHPVNSPPPVKSVEWEGTGPIRETLLDCLADPDERIRGAGVEGLRETKDPMAVPKLSELFQKETNIQIRRSILATLGSIKDERARPLIVVALDSTATHSTLSPDEQALTGEAIFAAERIGGRELVVALTNLVATATLDAGIVRRAIEALGNLKANEAGEVIVPFARHSNEEVRRAALIALGQIRGERALAVMLPLLDDASVDLRRTAIAGIGALKVKSAVPQLVRAANNPQTQTEAVNALAQLPDTRALGVYLDGLENNSGELRETCRKAIGAIQAEALPLIEARLSQLSPGVIAELQRVYQRNAKAQASPLFAAGTKPLEAAQYLDFALKTAGDRDRGRNLFNDPSGLACVKCHVVAGQGGNVGPDLSGIGAQYLRRELAESVLFPSKKVREGYQQVIVETKDGESISGLYRAETQETVTLQTGDGQLHQLNKADVKNRRTSELSLMPEGLHFGLSLQQFADLMAFLESLKATP